MILQKLQQARDLIKAMPLKKVGRNSYSNYDYYTPEQINQLVHEAEKQTGLIHIFNLQKDNGDVYGYLKIVEVETGEVEVFTQLTAIPAITATNIAQQIGGAVTYTNRYMLMTAFDISDNSLDFDGKDNREKQDRPTETKQAKPPAKKIMPDGRFQMMIGAIKKDTANAAAILKQTREVYTFTDDQEKKLADWENSI